MKSIHRICVLGLICGIGAVGGWASVESMALRRANLEQELTEVRQEILTVTEEVDLKVKALWQKQHELEQKDRDAARLRREVKELEAKLLKKREALNMRLRVMPEVREIESQRRKLYTGLNELRTREKEILEGMASLDAIE